MSLPTHPVPDPHADPLVASALRADRRAAAGSCPDAELLAMYAERDLLGSEQALVETHVHACARCQAMVAALVRALPEPAAAAAAEAERAPGGGFAAWFAGWRWLVPAASLTAVAVVVVWVGRGPADEAAVVAELGRAAGKVADGDSFVQPPATPAGEAAAGAQDRLALRRLDSAAGAPPSAAPTPDARERREMAARTLERASRARRGTAPTTAGAGETQAKAAADAAVRAEVSGLVASSVAAREAAAGAQPLSPEQRAANETAPMRGAAAVASPPPPPPPPAAMAPAAPARSADAAFRANLTAASWRVSRGVVERSQDGVAWARVPPPAGVTIIAVASVSADVCWAITTDAVFTVTDGVTWTRTARPPAGPLTNVGATSARAATVTAGSTRFVTTDGGATWAPVR